MCQLNFKVEILFYTNAKYGNKKISAGAGDGSGGGGGDLLMIISTKEKGDSCFITNMALLGTLILFVERMAF